MQLTFTFKSYLNADAFLGGLILNQDNIALRPEYEDILRFYGFDIGIAVENSTANSLSGLETLDTNNNTSSDNTTANPTDFDVIANANINITDAPVDTTTIASTTTMNLTDVSMADNNSVNSSGNVTNVTMDQTTDGMAIVPIDSTAAAGGLIDMMAVETSPVGGSMSSEITTNSDEMDMIPTVSSAIDVGTVPSVRSIGSKKKRHAFNQRSFNAIPGNF